MEDILAKMNEEKRLRLINSALKEFGAHRFEKASTNIIVKDAEISKGLLYHYFVTKEALFDYLLVFTMKVMGQAITDQVDWEDGDLFGRMQRVLEIKLGILNEYPYMLDFGKTMYDAKSIEEIKKLAEKCIPDLYFQVYSHNINYALFKDKLDVKRAVKMLQLFLDGFSEQFLAKYKRDILSTNDLKEEMKELDRYLEMYKAAFYKGE